MGYLVEEMVSNDSFISDFFKKVDEEVRIIFTCVTGILSRVSGVLSAEVDFEQLVLSIEEGIKLAPEQQFKVSCSIQQIVLNQSKVFKRVWFRELAVSVLHCVLGLYTVHVPPVATEGETSYPWPPTGI
jgi:hypothetical protein